MSVYTKRFGALKVPLRDIPAYSPCPICGERIYHHDGKLDNYVEHVRQHHPTKGLLTFDIWRLFYWQNLPRRDIDQNVIFYDEADHA